MNKKEINIDYMEKIYNHFRENMSVTFTIVKGVCYIKREKNWIKIGDLV